MGEAVSQEQVRKSRPQEKSLSEQLAEETKQRTAEEDAKRAETLDDLDALLDEIDSVLEENAEEFVAKYVQKGGQ